MAHRREASDPLKGRSALVTGATRGIGRAVAEALARAGAEVALVARGKEDVEKVAADLGGLPLPADVTSPDAVRTAVDGFVAEYSGPPDLVVQSAGVFSLAPVVEESVERFDRNLAANLRASFLVARAVLPGMLEAGEGILVNVGSIAGRRAFPANGAYSASKFGLRGLHEVLLEETRGTGVRVSLLEPAATDTTIWDPLDPDGSPELPSRSVMLRPEDVADTVLFLASRPAHVRIPYLPVERA